MRRPFASFVARPLALALAGVSFAVHPLAAQIGGPLRVIRSTPTSDASPVSTISVTFDRPVAGSLDRTVDPKTILSVTPAVAGRLEWRDPVTIRLVPNAPLSGATAYQVTVSNTFAAMDGSRLAEPYVFTFRVRGPTLLAGDPVGPNSSQGVVRVGANESFQLTYSAPVDLARLSSAAFVEFPAVCVPQRIIALRATGQRPLSDDDDYALHQTGEVRLSRGEDSLRRVVHYAPQTPLPRGCAGELVAPNELAADAARGNQRWLPRAASAASSLGATSSPAHPRGSGVCGASCTTRRSESSPRESRTSPV